MIKFYQPLCASLLAILVGSAHSQQFVDDFSARQTSENSQKLVDYVLHLGAFLGYDLSKAPETQTRSDLFNVNKESLAHNYLFTTLLGAQPLSASNQTPLKLVPESQSDVKWINPYSNQVFLPSYDQPSTEEGKVSVNPLIDQQTYQPDPVSQSILNFLGTPSDSFCMSNPDSQQWNTKCTLLYQSLVSHNVVGEIPSPNDFFSFKNIQSLIPQLNSNSLTSPILYDMTAAQTQAQPGSSSGGLNAANQAQDAANFIRYASGEVTPLQLPTWQAYSTAYSQALAGSTEATKIQAQATLSNYLTSLRSYTARMSVGLSNLYYIFSKRMPQKLRGDQASPKSQALTEFLMATRRLYNGDMTENKQWINELNDASSATVQKEIAVLLAEMNYQLYLNRQQQERILLTETMMIMMSAQMIKPDNSLNLGTTN
ncbi:MAG: type IV secretion protein IcmX [Legionellaceae bacterium]|nr:type IV secretion protein IcmX [Legionellaceae bacterium]